MIPTRIFHSHAEVHFMIRALALVVVLAFAAPVTLLAQTKEKPKKVVISDPKELKDDKDFVIQGEYSGKVLGKDEKIGVQVVAKGAGNFDLKVFTGGLPGDGWDEKTSPVLATANRSGDELRLNPVTVDSKEKIGILNGEPGKMIFTYTHDSKKISAGLSKVERKSPTLGAKPPEGAVVLFGSDGDEKNWAGGKLVELSDGKFLNMGIKSKQAFGSFKAHVEFRLPWMPGSTGQGRGNSGVYLQDRYEVQVLDSFGLKGENNECGGVYTLAKPSVNMCFPPMVWQTYDIDFNAAEFGADGKKTRNAILTLVHNGVKVHDKVELKNSTGGGQAEKATSGPFQLQNHGDPLVYRNIWVVEAKK